MNKKMVAVLMLAGVSFVSGPKVTAQTGSGAGRAVTVRWRVIKTFNCCGRISVQIKSS